MTTPLKSNVEEFMYRIAARAIIKLRNSKPQPEHEELTAAIAREFEAQEEAIIKEFLKAKSPCEREDFRAVFTQIMAQPFDASRLDRTIKQIRQEETIQ